MGYGDFELGFVRTCFRRCGDELRVLDAALAACVQRCLAGLHPAPGSQSAPAPVTLSAFGMNLHAALAAL